MRGTEDVVNAIKRRRYTYLEQQNNGTPVIQCCPTSAWTLMWIRDVQLV